MGPHVDFHLWLHMWGVSHVELTCGTHMWTHMWILTCGKQVEVPHVAAHVKPHMWAHMWNYIYMWKTGGNSTCGSTCGACVLLTVPFLLLVMQ